MKYTYVILVPLFLLFFNCTTKKTNPSLLNNKRQKVNNTFIPDDGECIFFVGQDLKATGGVDNYNDGYCDYFDVPTGITVYTNFSPGDDSYGYVQKGNDGIKTIVNWGTDDTCAQCYINDNDYKNTFIAIGLSLVNHEKKVANGQHNTLIRELGQWIKDSNHPVFLRIGYEFDGWEWNHYNLKHYLLSWKRIHTIFDEMNVKNVAYVWQSKGNESNQKILEQWYPGDDLVDWCGYSYFNNPDQEMLTFARKHKKPVFIAEATPVLGEGSMYSSTLISNPETAKNMWENWFIPFLKTIHENQDVIKAFSYINADWSSQPMWRNNPIFQKVDSRIQKSEYISKKWEEEMAKPKYLKPSKELWNSMEFEN